MGIITLHFPNEDSHESQVISELMMMIEPEYLKEKKYSSFLLLAFIGEKITLQLSGHTLNLYFELST